jgi:mono/diheme cytochrome c family protein
MPSLAWKLDDAQVASVTTYIPNAWPPAASAAPPGDVEKSRAALQARTD